MGCVYIPPENSLYSSNELVNVIEKDMKCALVGDFNAKTAVLEDFSEPDVYIVCIENWEIYRSQ